ncbi:MAG: hypothetical protein Fur0012_03140 [Elusimicrobiota bacterium]
MKKLFFAIVLMSFFPLHGLAQDAYLNKIKGKVEIFDSSANPRKALIQSPLYEGYLIRTGSGAECEIVFKDKSVIFVSENTELKIEKAALEKDKRDFSLDFLRGKILFFVQKMVNSAYRIKTPTAVCAVRGTDFSVIASSDSALVGLFEGKMEIEKGKTVRELNPGAEAEIKGDIAVRDRLSHIMQKEKIRAEKLKKYVENVRLKMEKRDKKIKERDEKIKSKMREMQKPE